MFCPSCGKSIPDNSIFCMFCGKPVQLSTASPQVVFNMNVPVQIKNVTFNFIGPMEQKFFALRGTLAGRQFRIGVQMVDSEGQPTAYDGTLRLEGTTPLVAGGGWNTMGKLAVKLDVKAENFGRSQNDETWYYYTHPTPVFIDGEYIGVQVKVWFTPSGSNKPLYFQKLMGAYRAT